LEEPVLTQWRLVGAYAYSFGESFQKCQNTFSAIRNSAPSDNTAYKIANYNINFSKSKHILNDLDLLCLLHIFVYFPIKNFFRAVTQRPVIFQFPNSSSSCTILFDVWRSEGNGKWMEDNVRTFEIHHRFRQL